MAILANLVGQTLVVIARYPGQYLIFGGKLYYPDYRRLIRVAGNGYVHTSPDSYWDVLTIVDGSYAGPPFSGRTPWHQWDGSDDDSTSSTIRHAKLCQITDTISQDSETFTCVVHTKIYSFDSTQLYKRLFWWGLDGIFRTGMSATVMPIVYGGSVTWGELRERGITWEQLLHGTWGRPVAQQLSVETVVPEIGATAQRKFVKFMKKLRFRQVQFQIVFQTRGDDQTAPVRLFSLHAEVTPAQAVSKAIS